MGGHAGKHQGAGGSQGGNVGKSLYCGKEPVRQGKQA